jgi:hypothetical protein
LDERLTTERSENPMKKNESVLNEKKIPNISNYNSNNNLVTNKSNISKEKTNYATESAAANSNIQKSTLHVIQIPMQKNNQNSPEKNSQIPQVNKNSYNTNKLVNNKGLNIIPIKSNLNIMTSNYNSTSNKDDVKLEKLSPKIFTGTKLAGLNNYNTNLSPKNEILSQNSKVTTSTTKNFNDMRFNNEIKGLYKSPSPSRGTNTTTTRYLKKSPEIKK